MRSPRASRSITPAAAARLLCSCTASSGLPSMPSAQQRRAVARVLAGDGVGQREQVDGAQAQVGEVADRRGDDVECAGRKALATGGAAAACRNSEASMEFTRRRTTKADRRRRGEDRPGASATRRAGAGGAELSGRARPARGGGEVDLILRERDGTLVFAEVRARAGANHGGAAASVGAAKQRRIVLAAQHYLLRWPARRPPLRRGGDRWRACRVAAWRLRSELTRRRAACRELSG